MVAQWIEAETRTLRYRDRDQHQKFLITYYGQRKAIDCSIFIHQRNIQDIFAVVQWLMIPLIIERFGIRFPGTVIPFFSFCSSLLNRLIHVLAVQSTVTVTVLEGMSFFQHLSEPDHRCQSRGCACVRASLFRCSGFDSHSRLLSNINKPNCDISS